MPAGLGPRYLARMRTNKQSGAAPDGAAAAGSPAGSPLAGAKPLFDARMATFMGAMILANVGGMMFFPILPLYLRELDAGVDDIGLFFTLSMIMPLAMQIAGGWLSDRIGRLKSIAIGSVAGMLGWVGTILAPSWPWLLVGQVVGAVSGAFVSPSFDAYIAERSDEKNRARVYGVTNTLFQVVSVVGPLAGGLAARFLGWRSLIWIAASLYFAATLIRLAMAREASRSGETQGDGEVSLKSFGVSLRTMLTLAVSGGVITWLLLSDGVRDIAFGLSGNLLPLFLQEHRGLDVAAIGLLNSLSGVASMLVMIPAGHFADKAGERWAIAAGYATAFVALMLLILFPSPWTAGASFVAFGFAMGMLQPAYQSLISKAVPENLRGIAFGFLSTSNGLVALPAPWLGAMLWKGVAPVAPFWVTAAAALLIIPPVLAKFRIAKAGSEGAAGGGGAASATAVAASD